MNNLSIIQTNPVDDFVIDDLIKDDPDIYIHSNDPELQCSKFLFVIGKVEAEIEGCRKNAQNMIDEINSWLENQIDKRQKQIEFMANFCRNYLKQKNLKSLSLPAGTISFRKQQDKIVVADSDKFFEHATFDIIRVVPEAFEPDMQAIKSKIKETGAIPEGIEVTIQEPRFYYKLNTKDEK